MKTSYYVYLNWAFEIIKTNVAVPKERIDELKGKIKIGIKRSLPTIAAINTEKNIVLINPDALKQAINEISNSLGMSKETVEEFVLMFAMIHELFHPLYNVDYYEETAKRAALEEISRQNASECSGFANEIAENVASVAANIFHDALINERVIGTLFHYYRVNYGIEAAVRVVDLYKQSMKEFVFRSTIHYFVLRDFGEYLKPDIDIDWILDPVLTAPDAKMKYAALESLVRLVRSINYKKLCENAAKAKKIVLKPLDVDTEAEPDEMLEPEENEERQSTERKPPAPQKAFSIGGNEVLDILDYINKEPEAIASMSMEGIDLNLMISGLRKTKTEITPLKFTPKDIIARKVFSRRLRSRVPKMYARVLRPAGAVFIVVDISGSIFTHEYVRAMVSIASKLASDGISVYFVPFSDDATVVKPSEFARNYTKVAAKLLEIGGGGTNLAAAMDKIKETIKKEKLKPPFSILIFSDFEVAHDPSVVPPGNGWLYAAGVDTTASIVREYVKLVQDVNPKYKVQGYLMDPVKSTKKKAVFVKCC